METKRRIGCRRMLLYGILSGALLCVLTISASAISNQFLPKPPDQLDHLTDLDKARIAEAVHLKGTLGDEVWPGWGSTPIPIEIWNSEYAFLYLAESQPPGWVALDETFEGMTIFRRAGTEDEQAFTESLIGTTWAGTLGTKYEMDNGFIAAFRDHALPPPINNLFPYRFLILPTEVYTSAVLHETFHAYQAMTWKDRFDDAEKAYPAGDSYWQADESMHDAWSREVDHLIRALNAKTEEETIPEVRAFLDQREQRRREAGLTDDQILFEQRFEWLEGLAKYVEIGIWEAASKDASYEPVPEVASDPNFGQYKTYNQRFSQELFTMRNMARQEGDSRLYYTGMAQARLLDRLLPGWKDRIGEAGVWLEDLLAEAVGE